LEQAKRLVRTPVPKSRFPVFVFGPYLEPRTEVKKPDFAPDDPAALIEHAKYLRYLTASKLEADGFTVHFGETEKVKALWQDRIASLIDLANIEIQHAHHECGAVVVFPSSVGSFCELSLFAAVKPLAEKTIAIVHKKHEKDESFFRRGLLRVLRQESGTYEFEDYANHDLCVRAAHEFVTDRYVSLFRAGDAVKLGILRKRDLEEYQTGT
jgi:hypothetical protein